MNRNDHIAAALLLRLAAGIFVIAALPCSPWLAGQLDPEPPLEPLTVQALPKARLVFLGIGSAMLVFAELISPAGLSRFLVRLFDRPIAAKLLLAFLSISVPLTIMEVGLRPFTIAHNQRKKTNLFVRDADLGWRLRPGVKATWGEVEGSINTKGLRGPVIPYPRQASKPRILYLGDSVTFGYRLAYPEQSYPYRMEALLEETLGRDVETVNAGVGGYSPWQQRIYLEQEGFKYRPDLVVLGFVLNDVTEKFKLLKFGGEEAGYQLESSYMPVDDWLCHNSVVYLLLQRLKARLRFGSDVQKGAIAHEIARVRDLANFPQSPKVQHAWSVTLENLDEISKLCEEERIPLAIVVFPYRFQFENPERLAAPQKKLLSWCERQGVPCLDLLPLLVDYLKNHKKGPGELYLDHNHFSAQGSRIMAHLVISWLQSQEQVWSRIKNPSPEQDGKRGDQQGGQLKGKR